MTHSLRLIMEVAVTKRGAKVVLCPRFQPGVQVVSPTRLPLQVVAPTHSQRGRENMNPWYCQPT